MNSKDVLAFAVFPEGDVSERGTWVTEYIYCSECVERFWDFLNETQCANNRGEGKYWSFARVGEHAFAGRISGMYAGEELQHFEHELVPKLGKMLCHPLRIAVLADSGDKFFTVLPPVRPLPQQHKTEMTDKQLKAREPFAKRLADRLDSNEAGG